MDDQGGFTVDAPVEAVRRRLAQGTLVVGSVWFPTGRELDRWARSAEPLFLRWLGDDTFEVGPRLHSIQAARFTPVARGTLRAEAGGTRVDWRVAGQPFTQGLLAVWTVILAGWGAVMGARVLGGDDSLAWLVWWGILAAGTAAAAGLGRVSGGRELRARLGSLAEVAGDTGLEDEDWA